MDVRISQLPEPKHLTPGDLIPLVSHGDNVAISLEHFLFEISHILDNVPCSALHIAKDAKVKALQAITKAQEAYTIAKMRIMHQMKLLRKSQKLMRKQRLMLTILQH